MTIKPNNPTKRSIWRRRPDRAERWWFVVLAAVALIAVVLAVFSPRALLFGYLSAYMFWLAIPLGSALLIMLNWLIPGRWSASLWPIFAAAAGTVVLFIPLMLPVLLGAGHLYSWVGETHESSKSLYLPDREVYLNLPSFLVRATLFLLVWAIGARMLTSRLRSIARANEPPNASGLAAAGVIIYVLTISFAAIDWIAALDSHWYSSIVGLYLVIGQVLLALTVATRIALRSEWFDDPDRVLSIRSADVQQDVGTLLLTCVALHAYIAFAQFFIIWNGNLQHENSWYLPRTQGVWSAVSIGIMALHFGLPFIILLSREKKRNDRWMAATCTLLICMRWVECVWMVLPADREGFILSTLCAVLSLVVIGVVWMIVFRALLARWVRLASAAPRPDGGSAPTGEVAT
jgi:hypothetical protein